MVELTTMLDFRKDHSSSFYAQANGQVYAMNKILKTILKQTINASRSNWHIMFYPMLWAYRMNVKTATRFSPIHLVHGVEAVKHCHLCQIYTRKMRSHPTPLFPIIVVGPFTKWGVDFMTWNLVSDRGHMHIIVVVDYFTKWAEAMPTFKSNGEIESYFVFNQIIARFGILKQIVTDHGGHF